MVSNPTVLDTVTVSTSQVVVTAKAAGSSSLVLWDERSNARILDVYADVDIWACAMEFGRSTPTNQCRLRLSREGCW